MDNSLAALLIDLTLANTYTLEITLNNHVPNTGKKCSNKCTWICQHEICHSSCGSDGSNAVPYYTPKCVPHCDQLFAHALTITACHFASVLCYYDTLCLYPPYLRASSSWGIIVLVRKENTYDLIVVFMSCSLIR